MISNKRRFLRRKERVRAKILSNLKNSYDLTEDGNRRFRLSVFRSNKHIYAQIIDDIRGITLVSASSINSDSTNSSNISCAVEVGRLIAERAKKNNIKNVVFDKGGYVYHGRVKALAEEARKYGLIF